MNSRKSGLSIMAGNKIKLRFILVLFSIWAVSVFAEEWRVIKSQHFIVHYLDDKNFARSVSRRAESYYDKIASDLGYSRYDKFWQWENRVKVYIYATHEGFIKGTGIPRKWATGVAKYDEKEIISYRWNEGFLDKLLPHELTHLIFRDFVGFPAGGEGIPLWIDEGVAQWEEKGKKEEAEKIVKELIKNHGYIPVRRLTRLDIREEDDFELARNFYAEAITLVGYLIEKHGGRKFTFFCRELRDGKGLDDALASTYGNSMDGAGELEKKWLEHYGGG